MLFPLTCFYVFKDKFGWEGNGNPLQCSCLENPRGGRAWWAAVYGVAQSRTRLKWLSSSRVTSEGRKWYKRAVGYQRGECGRGRWGHGDQCQACVETCALTVLWPRREDTYEAVILCFITTVYVPCGSVLKNLPANAGDARHKGSIPGSGRSLGIGNGNPLQYSCLENFMKQEPGGQQSMGSQRVGHDSACTHNVPDMLWICAECAGVPRRGTATRLVHLGEWLMKGAT